jgi:hypothetical protein
MSLKPSSPKDWLTKRNCFEAQFAAGATATEILMGKRPSQPHA